jgi:hypothetical protein
MFGFLKISPPLGKENLETKITELKEKLDTYVKEGEAKLKEEEDRLGEGKLDDDQEEHLEEHYHE